MMASFQILPTFLAKISPIFRKEVKHEPMLALDGGEDGLVFYRRLAEKAAAHLKEGGFLAVEFGIHQWEEILSLFEGNGRVLRISKSSKTTAISSARSIAERRSSMTEKVEVNDLYYKDKVKALGRIIREGGLVAFPTETVYGLGGNALDAGAAKKIYAAKGRPSDNPLIVHVADPSEVEKYAAEVSPLARRLMGYLLAWGPLTIVFPKKDCIPGGNIRGTLHHRHSLPEE